MAQTFTTQPAEEIDAVLRGLFRCLEARALPDSLRYLIEALEESFPELEPEEA